MIDYERLSYWTSLRKNTNVPAAAHQAKTAIIKSKIRRDGFSIAWFHERIK